MVVKMNDAAWLAHFSACEWQRKYYMMLYVCHSVCEHDVAVTEITLLLLLFAGTIFCEFLRFGKIRKIKYLQKFLPTYQVLRCTRLQSQTLVTNSGMGCHISTCFAILFIVSAFSFFSCCTVMSWRKWSLMTVMATWDSRVKLALNDNGCRLHDGACYFRVKLSENYIAAILVQRLPNLRQWILKLNFVSSQNWARRNEIAKINTRKIVTIPKSQNFVLTNNSMNNKVNDLTAGVSVYPLVLFKFIFLAAVNAWHFTMARTSSMEIIGT